MRRARAAAALALCLAATACADAMLAGPAQVRSSPDLSGSVRGTRTTLALCRFEGVGPPAAVVVDGRLVPRDELARLNPADIADVTIRKGVDAAQEYGADGAGGVVIVTTRAAAAR